MKFLFVFVALFAVTLARPDVVVGPFSSTVVRQDVDVHPEGFKFGVETSDGSRHDAEGQLKVYDHEHAAVVVHGSYTFSDKNGVHYTVDYVADENGFQPKGEHLPKL